MKKIIVLLLLAIGVVGCSDPKMGKHFKLEDVEPIGVGLSLKPEYSMFVEMLKIADVYNALNLGGYAFTIFAPSNDAVQNYLDKYEDGVSLYDMPKEDVAYLAKYHILSGASILSGDLFLQLPVPTATGKFLTANINKDTGDRYIDNGNDKNASNIVKRDMTFSNGYVHEIDNMLQPITSSIWDVVSTTNEYSIFADVIRMCGLESLYERYETEINDVKIADDKTLFVVPNSAFDAQRIATAKDLYELLPNGDPKEPTSDLYQWLMYHTMYDAVGYSELTTFPIDLDDRYFDKSHNLETMLPLSMMSIEDKLVNGKLTTVINPHDDARYGQVKFLTTDIPALNGYVHVVDKLMNIPATIGRYTFVWDPLSAREFKTIQYYGYKNRTDLPARETTLKLGEIPGINWKSIPASAARVYYRNTGFKQFTNGDALIIDLGTNGYCDMDVPILSTGKYKIYTVRGTDKGGIASIGNGSVTLDGVILKASMDFGNGIYGVEPKEDFIPNFIEATTHKLRLEPNSSTGAMGFDIVVFDPI